MICFNQLVLLILLLIVILQFFAGFVAMLQTRQVFHSVNIAPLMAFLVKQERHTDHSRATKPSFVAWRVNR